MMNGCDSWSKNSNMHIASQMREARVTYLKESRGTFRQVWDKHTIANVIFLRQNNKMSELFVGSILGHLGDRQRASRVVKCIWNHLHKITNKIIQLLWALWTCCYHNLWHLEKKTVGKAIRIYELDSSHRSHHTPSLSPHIFLPHLGAIPIHSELVVSLVSEYFRIILFHCRFTRYFSVFYSFWYLVVHTQRD